MAKRAHRAVDVQKRWDEGVGQGEGSVYKPWITIQSFPSRGRSHRIKGWKTGRVHHFLSDLEESYFYMLEWSESVVDIREQYPLWPRELTKEIAEKIGVRPAMIPSTKELTVVTTDFLLTVNVDGGSTFVARTVKYAKDLEKLRTIGKLEIERLWWQSRGVDWGIITEKQIPKIVVKNVKKVHSLFNLEGWEQLKSDSKELSAHLTECVQNSELSLAGACRKCDSDFSMDSGSFLALSYHLVATRQWIIDMEKDFNPARKLDLIKTELKG